MGILRKYVAKEILVPFAIAFFVITLLLLAGELLHELVGRFSSKGLALRDMAMIVFYVVPALVPYTLPIALLFATLIAFIQLSRNCEVIAMQAAGIPVRAAFAPAVLIGIVAAALLFVLRAEVSPWARRELRVFIVKTVLENPTLVLREQAWTPEFKDMRIFVGRIDDERMMLEDIDIFIENQDELPRTIVAREGRIRIEPEHRRIFLELSDGSIHEYKLENPDEYSTTTFRTLTIPVNIGELQRYLDRYQRLDHLREKEMSLKQIVMRLSSPSLERRQKRELLQQIGERTALSFMPLTFVLIGAPLGIIPYKTRRSYGLVICALLLLAYYSLLILGETLDKKQVMNSIVAMWVPNIFLGVTGIILIIRAGRH